MKMLHTLSLLLALLSLTFHASTLADLCAADLQSPNTPSGYPCKPLNTTTVEDFTYTGLQSGPFLPPYGVSDTQVSVSQMLGLNGQGLSVARLDILGGGVVPLHTHPNAAEMIIVVKGTMTAGFITQTSLATSTVYMKTLKEGDVMVFPQGLTHFQFNPGKEVSTAYASYSSSKPDLQLSTVVSFGNNLPPPVVSKVTYITISEVLRLKVLFGGTLA